MVWGRFDEFTINIEMDDDFISVIDGMRDCVLTDFTLACALTTLCDPDSLWQVSIQLTMRFCIESPSILRTQNQVMREK